MRGSDITGAKRHFLDVKDAEVVDGPDVIADKVAGALKDADRFGLQGVKPPLTEALGKVTRAGTSAEAPDGETPEQNALAGAPAEVDRSAGSAEVLKPSETSSPS